MDSMEQHDILQFNTHRIFRQDDNVFLYNVYTSAFYEINEDVAELLKHSGRTYADVVEHFAGVWKPEEVERLLDDLASVLVLETKENKQETRMLFDYQVRPIASLTLFMIQECNLRCSYCYGGDGEYNDKGMMSTLVAKQAVEFLLKNSGQRKEIGIVFFGGEPLMNFPLIQETVLYAREREKEFGKHISFNMTSNGTLLTDKIEQFLEEHNIRVQLSIDGDEETHNANRYYEGRVGSYDKIIQKTQNMRDKNKLTARATVTGQQLDLVHTFNHLVELGFRSVAMSPAANLLSDEDYKALVINNIELVREFDKLLEKGDYQKAAKMKNVTSLLNKIHVGGQKTHFCGAGTNMYACDVHGNLYPCHRFVSEKEYAIGSIFTGTSQKAEEFIEEVHIKNRTTCESCWVRNFCTGGCHHENLVMTNSTQTPYEKYCMTTRAVLREVVHLYLRLSDEQKQVLLGHHE